MKARPAFSRASFSKPHAAARAASGLLLAPGQSARTHRPSRKEPMNRTQSAPHLALADSLLIKAHPDAAGAVAPDLPDRAPGA